MTTTKVTHRLVGYHRSGDHIVAVEYDVPTLHLDFAKRLAGVGADDPEAVLCYKLSPMQARDLAGVLGKSIAGDEFTFYLEGFAGR